ncbi:DUF3108 domain-containing protein [Pandoraea terrae]|nr:DUF3108 domain-containing protein [Pandoraea terrae]
MQPDVKSVLIGAGFGILNGNVHVGVVEETLTFTDNKFDIRSVGKPAEIVAKVFKNATIVRQSDGNISAGRFFTARYMERRGESYEKTAVIDTRGKKVHFYDGQNLVADSPLPGGVTDNLSFPYAFLGRKMPAAPIHAVATDGRTMRPMTFDVSEEMLVIGKQNYPAVKLRRRKIESDDAGIELWFLRGSNFPLRVRVEMSQKYGVIVDQTLRGAPAVL